MPSRKSGSTDVQRDSRRTSLRHLSSIASFQALFNRRRSNNATDSTVNSSSSNLSTSSSTIVNPPEPAIGFGASMSSSAVENGRGFDALEPNMANLSASRRSSYICLPDDPIGGMPRSRTFSNLPLPTRARKTASLIPSLSHARLPSALLPSTRLPSPPASTRKHSHTRLASIGVNVATARNRMKRSDTEPLLPVNVSANNQPRSTMFKENISLSPIKPLPTTDLPGFNEQYSSPLSSTSYISDRSWLQHEEAGLPRLSSRYSAAFPSAQHPALRADREYKSSPARRSSKDRPPTPGGSRGMDLERRNSQPILKNMTNTARRPGSQHREIRQTRLLSARQAPTPQPPRTPKIAIPTATADAGKLKTMNNSGHIRQISEKSPTRLHPPSPHKAPASPTKKGAKDQIATPEPPEYWLGRLCALADRYRNDELAAHLAASKAPPKCETDKMHTPEAATARLRRALECLHAMCTTEEARDSLSVFRLQYAALTGCSELLRPVVLSQSVDGDAGVDEMCGIGEARKVNFMERLLGRQKRRSLVMM